MPNEAIRKSEVGRFTGGYAMVVKTCLDPFKDIPADARVLRANNSFGGRSAEEVRNLADRQVAEHLEGHRLHNTAPCIPFISPVYEVHEDALRSGRIVWVPLPDA